MSAVTVAALTPVMGRKVELNGITERSHFSSKLAQTETTCTPLDEAASAGKPRSWNWLCRVGRWRLSWLESVGGLAIMIVADSTLALGRGGFRFSGLGTIENEEEKKSQSW